MKTNHPLLNQPTDVEVVDDSHEPWILVRCKQTDFHFIANPPEYDRLSEEFAWEKTIESERDRRHREERLVWVISSIAKRVKFAINPKRNKMFVLAQRVLKGKPVSSFRVLDVGCGNGKNVVRFCQRFKDIGVTIVPFGIEVSSFLADESRERLSVFDGDVIENNAIDGMAQVEQGSLDVVTMLSFLEHESRPLELLKTVHGALKPDGSIILKVPNFACWNRKFRGRRWAGYRFPDHVSYFTPATLQLLAEQAGFQLMPQKLSERFPTNDNMYAVLQKAA